MPVPFRRTPAKEEFVAPATVSVAAVALAFSTMGVPTVGIYCATDPRLTGLHGGPDVMNVGAPGAPPAVATVASAIGMRSADA